MKKILALILTAVLMGGTAFAMPLEGQYACELENGEMYVLEITDVNGTLYAQGALAMGEEDGGSIYSFCGMKMTLREDWAYDVAAYSVMSGPWAYWDDVRVCEFSSDGDDFIVTGGLPLAEGEEKLVFALTDSFESMFPYTAMLPGGAPEELMGAWVSEEGACMTIGEQEVRVFEPNPGGPDGVAAGSYEVDGDRLSMTLCMLGYGAMPVEREYRWQVEGDTLTVTDEETSFTLTRCPLAGRYVLSPEKNADQWDALYTLFGSSLRDYGAELNLYPDGHMEYYMGLTGGWGSWEESEGRIQGTVLSYAERNEETVNLRVVEEDGETYLALEYRDEAVQADIWWAKE